MSQSHCPPRPPIRPLFRRLAALSLLSLTLGTGGCDADEPATPQADPLRAVDIPEGFTFSTTRGAVVELAFAERFMLRRPLTVELTRADGFVLYAGGVPGNGRMQAKLLLPRGDEQVNLRVRGRRGLDETISIDVTEPTTALEVE